MRDFDYARMPILVVDDEQDNLDAFRFVFRRSFSLHYALGGESALAMLDELDPAVIVTDQRMPHMTGIELLRAARHRRPEAVGVLITAYTDLPVLLEAINSGAVHRYVQKPWDSKELSVILKQAIEHFSTMRENRTLREQLSRYTGYLEGEHRDPLDFGELAWAKSPSMRDAVREVEKLSALDGPVLISGEPGTEKDLFARAVHVGSRREASPFVQVSSLGMDDVALEREMFGWRRGAFEGALTDRPGRLELSYAGTLVLHGLPRSPALCDAIAQAFERGCFRRLGGDADVPLDARLVVTTVEDLASFAMRGGFFGTMASQSVTVPPLRDRTGDLPGIATRLLVRFAERHGRPARQWGPEAMARLLLYPWPGNLAELAAVAERAALVGDGEIVGPDFGPALEKATTHGARDGTVVGADTIDLPSHLDQIERRELCAALERCAGNKAEVARALGIHRTTLYYRLRRLGIEV